MKKYLLTPIYIGAFLAFTAPLVSAEKASDNPAQTSKVLETMQSKGFNIVSELEFKDGNYNAIVINAEGRSGNIVYNAQTGEIVKDNDSKPGLTALDIARAVEHAGYHNISKINTQWLNHKYNVTALSENGEKSQLVVDAQTGNISKE